MGFLNRTVFAKRLNKTNLFVLAIIAGIISCGLTTAVLSSSTFAEEVVDNYGLYTDSDGVRWEWEVVSDSENTDEPQKINLMFYDKPENLTTVTVPSYDDMTTTTGVTPASDTYYVRNADQESQDTRFTNPDPARRTANQTDVTVLDMTNTSKVQILGVKPIINPETEVELIFGENMVIGDGVEITKSAVVDVCTSMIYYDSYRYKCAEFEERDFNEVQDSVEGWNDKTIPEKQNYQLSLTDLVDCKALSYFDFLNPPFWGYGSYSYDSTKCYARIVSRSETIGGVFSNYRLKLTNLQNIKYFGWFAFSNSVLNESNYSVSIKANQTAGEGVFEGTNVKNVSFEGTTTYPAMFRNCSDLESIDFGDVETVSYSTFENSPVGTSLDLSTTNIKTVLGKAFKNSGISELNLGSVEKLGFEAFANNNISDLDFPKTIKELLDGDVFINNPIQNVTVRFDTYQNALPHRFVETLGCAGEYYNTNTGEYSGGHAFCLNINLKKLDIIAPYSEDEEVSETHGEVTQFVSGSYDPRLDDYYKRKPTFSHEYASENFKPWTYKNVISGDYFNGLGSVEEIYIGEGYKYIGDGSFYSYRFGWRAHNEIKKISFPDSLLGIGQSAFEKLLSGNGGDAEGAKHNGFWVKQAHPDAELPSGLIYIGTKAFLYNTGFDSRFDLPDLEFLGDYSFTNTNVMDIYFHNKLVFAGQHSFYYYTGDSGYNDGSHIWEGKRSVTFDSDVAMNVDVGAYYYPARVKFGTITFGEHVTHIAGGDFREHLDDDGVTGSFGSGSPGLGSSGTMWHKVSVDKFDMGASQITAIPAAYFNGIFADEIVLPHNLKFIGSAAFYSATVNKEVLLPEGLEVISGGAFNAAYFIWNCDPVEDFYDDMVVSLGIKITKLPSSLKKVGKGAFFGDTNLTAVVDAELEDIRMNAFTGTGITGVILHPTTKSVGLGAFTANEYLRNIEIDADFLDDYSLFGDWFGYGWVWNNASSYTPAYVTPGPSINKSLDKEDLHFETVTIKANSLHAPSDQPCPYGRDSYGSSYCRNKDGTMGNYRPTNISLMSFFYGFNIDKIDLNEAGWDNIPKNMFLDLTLEELKLPAGIETIPYSAFYSAEIGGELKIPDSVTQFDSGAFVGAKFESLILPSSLESSYSGAFWGAEASESIIVPEGVTVLPDYMLMNTKAKKVELPSTLEVIGLNEFMLSKVEEELILPDSLKEIKGAAFMNERNFHTRYQGNPEGDLEMKTDVVITKLPESLERIGGGAFFGYDYELDIDLPNLKFIGYSAFMQSNVKSVKLYDKIESIESGAFLYNPKLRDIVLDCDFFGATNNWFYSVFSTIDSPLPETLMNYRDSRQNQMDDGSDFNSIVFTDKSVTNPDAYTFAYFTANTIDISNAKWSKIPRNTFYETTITEPITIPSTVTEIADEAFQWSNISLSNTFSEGLETIGKGAFYGADISGDLIIPSTVTFIGWSAFNAGDADTHYETVTIKPALNYDSSDSQAVFQLFWNASMDKLVIESPMLPVLAATGDNPVLPHEVQYTVIANGSAEAVTVNPTLRADGEPEFHGMTMREVEIKNLPTITANAFEECANLETVSFANHTNLSEVGKYAFNNDTKLKRFVFGDGLVGKDVALKEYAFNNTAVETIGNHNTDFDLTAANFNAVEPHVFSNMPKLTYVSIPSTFSIDASLANEELHTNGSTIPSYTFADDPELATVEVGYQLSTIREDAFANDNKITKLFLWGNTDIEENGTNLTIPEPTNIFAYSDAPGQAYANSETRADYDGKFYPLDEVLYLTSNKTYVILEQDEEGNNVDFDKDGLILYALRRDGVILESDDWQTYTKAFARASNPNIVFEEGKGAAGNLGTDEELMWTVYDAPKPFDTISLANQNYQETNFEFIQMPSSTNPLVAIHYPDGYTAAIRTTTLASMTKEEEEEMLRELEVPNTGALQAIVGVAAPSVSIATIVVLGGIYVARKRKN